jgi:LacI family transcriptional regulator
MTGRRVTMADVARSAGVSRTTTSFVLSGRTDMRISETCRKRVLEAARALGYRPNVTARSLRTKSTQTIGLVSDSITTTPFAGEVIRGAPMSTCCSSPRQGVTRRPSPGWSTGCWTARSTP